MGDVRSPLIHKGIWRHARITLVHAWFPSSRISHVCGSVNAKLKRERTWTCDSCGTQHDRNLNAAINLRNLIMLEGICRDGRCREIHAKANPVS